MTAAEEQSRNVPSNKNFLAIQEDRDIVTSETDDLSQPDFNIIWHNLTYKVDSRSWYTRLGDRFFRSESKSVPDDTYGTRGSNPKVILNQICGNAKSRKLTAILGPSGAGKSSLLYCLFQNRTVGTTGRVLVDSRDRNKLKVCFIPQQDYLNEWLTVREDLIFVSRLKQAKIIGFFKEQSTTSNEFEHATDENVICVKQTDEGFSTNLIDHEANATRVAELLGLSNCLDVMIKKISGGQKKRLSIARELMSKPDILVLDEPTTGLDSHTCYKTIQVLRDLAHHSPNPMAIVVTIHQPERAVFNLFDNTYFISATGRVIYDDSPQKVVETIENVAKAKLPSANYNPASFLIEVASDNLLAYARDQLSQHQRSKFSRNFDGSFLKKLTRSQNSRPSTFNRDCYTSNQHSISSDTTSPENSSSNEIQSFYDGVNSEIRFKRKNSIGKIGNFNGDQYFISYQLRNCLASHPSSLMQSFRHIFILTHRSWLSVIRNPTFTKSRLAFHILLPLIMLVVFGTQMGAPNNCPKLDNQLDMAEMSASIKEGWISQNVNEIRLSVENMSFFFILLYGFGINIISCTASFYPLTMHMFKKEVINGLYSSTPYFIGQMLAELPLEILFPSLSILLTYPLSGQLPSFLEWRMFAIAYIMFLVSYSIHSLGLLCGSIFVNNVSVAVLAGQAMLLPFVVLSGFIIRPTRMPGWMKKLSHTSPFKQGMNAIISARYGFNVCSCDEDMIPLEGESVSISGMTPQLKHVIEYMFPKSNSTGNLTEEEIPVTEIFDRLGKQFVKAQSFSLDIKSCDDVQPYLMHMFGAHDVDLFFGIGSLLLFIIVFKLITFYIMKSFPYRIN